MSFPQFLNASYYQNLPPEQVNWAQLAQQWIAMREAQRGATGSNASDVGIISSSSRDVISSHPNIDRVDANSGLQPHKLDNSGWINRSNSPGYGNFVSEPILGAETNKIPEVGSSFHHKLTNESSHYENYAEPVEETYGYRDVDASVDYRTDQFTHRTAPGDWNKGGFWHAEAVSQQPHPVRHAPFQDPFGLASSGAAPTQLFPGMPPHDVDYRKLMPNIGTKDSTAFLDIMQRRKHLPAWIREGLEKMEREKQRLKEKEEQDRIAKIEAERQSQQQGGPEPAKSKFDSDSDAEEEKKRDSPQRYKSPLPAASSKRSSRFHSPSPSFGSRSEEEIREQMLTKLRKWLTEILMEVTSEDIETLAEDVYKKSVSKAPARMLTQSSALAAISGLGFKGSGYDSDTSVDEDTEMSDIDAKPPKNVTKVSTKSPAQVRTVESQLPSPSTSKKTAKAVSDEQTGTTPNSGDTSSDQKQEESESESDSSSSSSTSTEISAASSNKVSSNKILPHEAKKLSPTHNNDTTKEKETSTITGSKIELKKKVEGHRSKSRSVDRGEISNGTTREIVRKRTVSSGSSSSSPSRRRSRDYNAKKRRSSPPATKSTSKTVSRHTKRRTSRSRSKSRSRSPRRKVDRRRHSRERRRDRSRSGERNRHRRVSKSVSRSSSGSRSPVAYRHERSKRRRS